MGLFSSKSPKEKLQDQYRKLMEQSYKYSTSDRKRSDELRAEAEQLIKQIEAM
ncbi:MAG: Lacal_2735 family protein [Bacteroidia bacterium]